MILLGIYILNLQSVEFLTIFEIANTINSCNCKLAYKSQSFRKPFYSQIAMQVLADRSRHKPQNQIYLLKRILIVKISFQNKLGIGIHECPFENTRF